MRGADKKKHPKRSVRPVTRRQNHYLRALEKNRELEAERQSLLEAQLELEISRERYAEFFDAAPVCFITLTRSGLIREINLAGARLLEHHRGHLTGWPFAHFVAKSDRRKFLEHLWRCRQNFEPTRPLSVEVQLARQPGGNPVFIELVSFPAVEKKTSRFIFKSVFRDITDVKQMQEVHRWLAAIVESSDDAIVGKDLNGVVISCNRGASLLFGYTREELIGQPMTFLIPPELQDEERKILQQIRRGESIEHYETIRRRKNGNPVQVSLTISPIRNARGKIIGASHTARDITRRKDAEKKLEESLAREKAARQTAEAAGRAKDDFLAALSHELRTPLNPALLLASESARNADLPPGARTDFDTIRKNIELEARLIDDLLDMTRVTRGKLTLNQGEWDLHSILRDAISTVISEIEQKQVFLNLDLGASHHEIFGDAVRLQQIFWNVLKNAVKFTSEGGKIIVETKTHDDRIVIKISDTGIGMNARELKRIFDAFSQGAHGFGGLGLGLAISRALVELHGGSIRASSPGKGRGATFLIELPLITAGKDIPDDLQKAKLSTPAIASSKTPEQLPHILLVEDHEPTRLALTKLLLNRHCQVTGAGSLAEARSLVKKEKKTFHLLISDIGLPDGNGCDLMKELREQSDLKGIALTGYGAEEDMERSRAAGFAAHLTKPVRSESLDQALSVVLRD